MADEAHRLEGRTVAVAGDKPERRTRFPAAVFRVAVRSSRRFGLGRLLGIVLLALFVLLRSWDPAPVETLRLRTFDLYQVLAPRQSATQAVVIVDLDEESLDAIGQWPWPRTIVAELVARVADYGSVAMAFDLVFAESDRMSPDVLAESLHGISEAARDELRGLPSNDQVFADVLRQNRVVLAQSGYQRDLARGRSRPISEIPIGTIGGDPRPFLIEFPGHVRNIPLLEDASLGDAMFTLLPERDGIVRRVPAVMTVDNVIIPSLALELLRVATGQDAFLIKVDEGGVRSVGVGGVEIPTDGNGRIWIHYTKHDPERYVSAKDVLSGTVAPERLARP